MDGVLGDHPVQFLGALVLHRNINDNAPLLQAVLCILRCIKFQALTIIIGKGCFHRVEAIKQDGAFRRQSGTPWSRFALGFSKAALDVAGAVALSFPCRFFIVGHSACSSPNQRPGEEAAGLGKIMQLTVAWAISLPRASFNSPSDVASREPR